ncbi:MAG: hypothetical protein PHS31_09350 [Victivallaceae bacterium]|nr:hypothetical protein [Victivallaceae bacterium]MDD4180764.1 hypothetical protein [Victivallaceae bacterium]
MKNYVNVFLIAVFLLVLTGCGTTAKFVYPAQMSSLVQFDSSHVTNKKLAVLPFDDYRSDDNNCMFPMYLIPLMPFGWGTYERPDAASMFLSLVSYDITPTEDLAKATAVSIRHSNLFKDVFFTMGGEKDNADLVLRGRIKIMKYHGKMFSYGLSVCGPILWIFGAPAGMSENRLTLELTLSDKKGKVLWDWSMDREEWIVQWLYSRMGHDCKIFTNIYQSGMNDALSSLARKMREHPELFK